MKPEDIWEHPDLTPITFNEIYDEQSREQGWHDISLQFKNLTNIGLDYISEYPEIFDSEEHMKDLINYVHDNYLPIQDIHFILGDEIKTKIVGKLLYTFLVLDFPTKILPKIIKDSDISLETVASLPLHESLMTYISTRISNINKILSVKSSYRKMQKDRFKNLFYMQLIDNELTDFKNKYILPLIELNYATIYSLIK